MMARLWVDIFGVVIEILLLVYYYTTVLASSRWRKPSLIGLYALTGLISFLATSVIGEPMVKTLCFLLITCLPAIAYPSKWSVKVFYAVLFTIVVAGLESLTKSILITLYGGWANISQAQNYIQGVMISKFLMVILTLGFVYLRKEKAGKLSPQLLGIFLILPMSTLIVIHQMMAVNYALGDSSRSMASAAGTSLLIMANIALFYLFDKQMAMAIKDQQLASQESAYAQMDQRVAAHNKLVHDMNHHLIAIRSYAEHGEMLDLLAYLQQFQHWSDTAKVYYTGSTAIDGILNAKLEQAQAQGIDLRYQLIGSEAILIEGMAVVTVLANGLDNALEATAQVTAMPRRPITCQIKVARSYLFITITNPIVGPLDYQSGDKLPTTKSDKIHHGFGLGNIADVAKAYCGSVRTSPKETTFTLAIMMQNQAFHDLK